MGNGWSLIVDKSVREVLEQFEHNCKAKYVGYLNYEKNVSDQFEENIHGGK